MQSFHSDLYSISNDGGKVELDDCKPQQQDEEKYRTQFWKTGIIFQNGYVTIKKYSGPDQNSLKDTGLFLTADQSDHQILDPLLKIRIRKYLFGTIHK